MIDITNILAECRKLETKHNESDINHWIVERKISHSDGYYLSVLKNGVTHFVSYQNGSIESGLSNRRRVGLWSFDKQHLSGLDIRVNGKSEKETFVKYVRGLGYIYRQYEDFERLDFISGKSSILEIELRSGRKTTFEIDLQVLHEVSWPQNSSVNEYKIEIKQERVEVTSNIASTYIYYESDGKVNVKAKKSTICIKSESSYKVGIYISCDKSKQDQSDLKNSLATNGLVDSVSNLITPSFRINKLFKWAKHDLLELFTSTPIGDGFYAGMPEFSWFFGRDGEWISMAAIECGMDKLAESHLNLLYSFAKNGRIPHEIALSNGGHMSKDNYVYHERSISTQFMSIDSSPLWVICEYMLSAWTGRESDKSRIKRVMEFCRSCDRDRDGFMENRFTEGLIGWPESWASKRDGICVDINALWLEALRLFNEDLGSDQNEFQDLLETYKSTFYQRKDGYITVFDSIHKGEKREIKGAVEIIPAVFFEGSPFSESLKWLYQPDMVTEWGVRSISNRDIMYDGGYHTGTIWPLMSGWMALALYNNSMFDEGFHIIESFVRLAFSSLDPGRINETYNPEFLYGEGQFFQGWSSSLFIQSVMEGIIGLSRIPGKGDLSSNLMPHLPSGWSEVKLLDFPFRGGTYDIEINKNNQIKVYKK